MTDKTKKPFKKNSEKKNKGSKPKNKGSRSYKKKIEIKDKKDFSKNTKTPWYQSYKLSDANKTFLNTMVQIPSQKIAAASTGALATTLALAAAKKYNSLSEKNNQRLRLKLKDKYVEILKKMEKDDVKNNVKLKDTQNTQLPKSFLSTLLKTENKYTVDNLTLDLKDPKFIENILNAEKTFIAGKILKYIQLDEVNYGEKTHDKEVFVDFSDIIKSKLQDLQDRYQKIENNFKTEAVFKGNRLEKFITDASNGLASIKGDSRENVKEFIIKIIYTFARAPKNYLNSFNNVMITGPAGSGKTSFARVLSKLYGILGIVSTDKVKIITKSGLISSYVGQTGPKTRSLMSSILEGVLFIDEAYSLTPCGSKDNVNAQYSDEAIAEMINFMDKFQGMYVVIVGGYHKQMYECFLPYNEGLSRRFPNMLDLVDFSSADLYSIFINTISKTIKISNILSTDQLTLIKNIIKDINEKNRAFNNQAGDIVNLASLIVADSIKYGEDYKEDEIKKTFYNFVNNKK